MQLPSDHFERRFLDFIARRERRVPRLRGSGQILGYGSHGYGANPDDIEWIPASGRATLHSYAVYRQQYHPDFPPPYNVAHVELEEGPRLISRIVPDEGAAIVIGMPLRAREWRALKRERAAHAAWVARREAAWQALFPDRLSRLVVDTGQNRLDALVRFFHARMVQRAGR